MEIGIGDKVRNTAGTIEGVVYLVGSAYVGYVSKSGGTYNSKHDEVTLVAKAHYQPTIEVGDKVMALESGKIGTVWSAQAGELLPYVVGFDSYRNSAAYSSKELKVIAKATYQPVEG